MSACLITTPYGKIFHTGDWKLDERPVLGRPTTADALTAIGDTGILAMVCDSTNVFNHEHSGSEGSVKDDLLKSVKAAKGRVVVTTFASNAARLKTLGEVARESGRTLCFAGRSLHRILEAAQANGYLKDLPKTIDMESVDSLARHEVMVVATGGQGEARAALARIAEGNHPVKLEEGDTVIFSSKQIPGNEIAIGIIMNKLAERNILTVTEKQAHVHVSGHPGQPELAALYDWIRPKYSFQCMANAGTWQSKPVSRARMAFQRLSCSPMVMSCVWPLANRKQSARNGLAVSSSMVTRSSLPMAQR
jgi:ribonuclease J